MRALLHRAYTWGTAAHFSLAHGAPAALEPAQECAVVFGFLQLALGLALPAAGQLVVETALFEQHQRQRQRRGLPPEAGLQAALYRVAGELADAAEGPAVAVWLWMLLGLLWDAALLLVMRRPL